MIATFIINGLLVSIAVLIHYEILRLLTKVIPCLAIKNRLRIVFGILGSLCAHILEMWLFAFGYYFLIQSGEFGSLKGNFDGSLVDCTYFSFSTYTSLGYGDIEPFGNLRFLAGLEALTGLVLITWTASFLFIEMRKFWEDE